MSLVADILGFERKTVDATALTLRALLGEVPSKTGQYITMKKALRVSAVLGATRVLAEGIAQMPFKLQRELDGDRKEVARKHPLHRVLWRRPNDWMTSFEFRETAMYHAVLARGFSALVSRNSRKEVLELLPLVPSAVHVRQDDGRQVWFDVTDAKGRIGTFPRSSILHIRGPSWDSVEALQMVDLAREAIGLALATEEAQARLHANGSRPAGILTYESSLSDDQQERIRNSWKKTYGGENQFGTAVLDLGAKYTQLAMSGVDAQTLESRRHQVEEIGRMLRVFPQMLGYSDKTSTYASAEQFFTAHVIHSLGPWVERWEQACDRDLLTEEEIDAGYRTKLDQRGLMRGDNAARSAYYKSALGTASSPGWLSPNDVRRLEDEDPSDDPGADKIMTADRLTAKVAPTTGAPDPDTKGVAA